MTFKKTYGFHPLACWCANTQECLAMLLREGNAGINTVADHLRVLSEALAQIPNVLPAPRSWCGSTARAPPTICSTIWSALNTPRRTVAFTVGWTITDGR